MKGLIETMNAATSHRMARLWRKPSESRAIFHRRFATGIAVVGCTLLLLMPNVARAESSTAAESLAKVTIPTAVIPTTITYAEPYAESSAGITPDEMNSDEIFHVIAVGDSLSRVAQRYNIEMANLATYNQILDYNNIVIGQKLRIPPVGVEITEAAEATEAETLPGADGYHVVRKGESLSAIGRLYNLSLDEIMALNDITEPNTIQMGKMLRVTGEVVAAEIAAKPEPTMARYVVKRGDTLAQIVADHHTTLKQVLHDNKTLSSDSEVHVGQELDLWLPADAETAFGVVDAPRDGERKIVIDLSEKQLTAYQGDVIVLQSIVSTGKDATPTLVGEFETFLKYDSQYMFGDDYDLPGVPWVMYYYDEFAIHGAYWHANFGTPTSHGCTNMTIAESKALYSWAPLGTKVVVQP
jgi:LysM repeat protein